MCPSVGNLKGQCVKKIECITDIEEKIKSTKRSNVNHFKTATNLAIAESQSTHSKQFTNCPSTTAQLDNLNNCF